MAFLQGFEYDMMYDVPGIHVVDYPAMDGAMADAQNGFSPDTRGGSAISPTPRVRKLFPETWLWSNSSTG